MSGFKEVVLCELKNKDNRVSIKDLSQYKDTLKKFEYPCELVGGLNQQVKPYFDEDLELNDDENAFYDEEVAILNKKLVIQSLFNLKNMDDIYLTDREARQKKDKTKYSYHYTVDKIRISNYNIKKLLEQNNVNDFDTSVYDKNRGMCCIYTSKKPNTDEVLPPFKPVGNADISKYMISYIEEEFIDYDLKFPKVEKKIIKESCLKRLFSYKDDIQLSFVSKLVLECLSHSRADDYNKWIELGWCLHNIDDRLLDLWIEFSNVNDKFQHGKCEDIWGKSKKGNLGLGSLKYWSKLDNKVKYDEIMIQQVEPVIDKSIRGDGAHSDVAEVVSLYMKDKIVYDTKVKSWFIVNDKTNIWMQDKEGVKVRLILSTYGCNLYMKRAMYWNSMQLNDNDELPEEKQKANNEKSKVSIKIASQLKNAGFKDSIMKELKSWCVQDNFIEECLDCNINLFAFKNGVYDLENNIFRNIEPTDYISTTTDYDYNPNIEKEYKDVIENFLKSTQKNDEMYKYLLDVITTMIYGKNYHQEFYIFNGKGANGKSVLMSLLLLTFGNYGNKINATTFTKPSKGANETSEMHSCKSSRLIMVEEPEETDCLITSRLKEFSGDGKIKTRGLHENAFSFDPQFGLIFFCNQIPALSKVDNAIGRRLRLVDFPFKFCDNPTKLNEKLIDRNLNSLFKDNMEYKQAFASIILDNWKNNKLNQEKLPTPTEVMKITGDYMDDCNEVKKFINENYDITDNDKDRESSTDLYRHFKCETNSKMDTKSFAYNMEELNIKRMKACGIMKWVCLKRKNNDDE
jgi:P4 family phage/plasmid primase-like protien